jgi:cation diffusion facilitator CzcD-associated flavoprotein CzcO
MPDPGLLDSPRFRDWPDYPAPAPTRPGPLPARTDVVIVGAGPAGLAVTAALWHLGVRDVVVLDRDGRPGGRFFDRVDALRQRVLRSPYEHHPGVEGYRDCELLDFARLHWALLTPVERREVRMAQAGHRSVVPLDVFQAYCRHVAVLHGLPGRLWRAAVERVAPGPDEVTVLAGGTELTARFVVLCLGEERRAAPPGWSGTHWDEPAPAPGATEVVVGAGLTAAHLIANALEDGRRVRWVVRQQSERYQCSDVNASFFRAEGRARFDGVPWADRLALMRRERRASVMFEFQPGLHAAEADGRLTVHRGAEVAAVTDREVRLADGTTVTGDLVRFALGTTPSIGGGLLPGEVVAARDGWPDLDERTLAYRAASRVFAAGAAACMVLGPAARNIDGHRVATARIATTIAAGLRAAQLTEVGPRA